MAPTLQQGGKRTRPFKTRPTSASGLEPSAYLTDGIRLYRVISTFSWPPTEAFAVLEDCLTLDTLARSADELYGMGLELVRGPRTNSTSAARG